MYNEALKYPDPRLFSHWEGGWEVRACTYPNFEAQHHEKDLGFDSAAERFTHELALEPSSRATAMRSQFRGKAERFDGKHIRKSTLPFRPFRVTNDPLFQSTGTGPRRARVASS